MKNIDMIRGKTDARKRLRISAMDARPEAKIDAAFMITTKTHGETGWKERRKDRKEQNGNRIIYNICCRRLFWLYHVRGLIGKHDR